MLIEMRTYTLTPGKLREFLALVEKDGFPLQLHHLGQCLGFYTTEVGPLNQVVQLWGYESASDRDQRRARLYDDPQFPDYLEKALPMIQNQENILLKPTSFSPTMIEARGTGNE